MRLASHRFLVLFSFAAVLAPSFAAAEKTKSPIGQKINDFTLKDYRGKTYSLSDFSESKLVVVVFLGTECPLAKLYGPRLEKLREQYAPQGVTFLGINANSQDSLTEVAAYARIHKLKFPVLKDLGNQVADQMQAVRTPEAFVLDADRKVRYWGRIDDQYGVGYVRNEVTRRDLAIALDQLLAGEDVQRPVTAAAGCHIGRVRHPNPTSKVTYSNQIARILQKRCVECHRDGEIAPFTLSKYEEVAGWAETIAEVVRDERMPPWHADPDYGTFWNDRRMPDEEKKLIYEWVAAGAPKGDPKQLPPSREYVTGWRLPYKPDRIIPMADKPFPVPAEGEVKYKYFTVDPGFKEDKWLKAAEIIPGNRAVVHHILIFVKSPKQKGRRDGARGFLVGYVPGKSAKPLPKGMAKFIPAGSKLVFQVHYTPIGSAQEDLSKVGLVFADPKKVTHMVVTTSAVQSRLNIPPHANNYQVEATSPSYHADVLLLSMSPHMHLRGKSFRFEALFPDGKKETLLDIPKYDFNWQTSYRLTQLKRLKAGTRIHCVAHFDNSEYNLANPDPTATVHWGDQTWDEMMIGYFDVAVLIDPKKVVGGQAPDLRPTAKSQAVQLISRFDANKDGKLIRKEVPDRHGVLFTLLDANKDGELTVEEVAEKIKQYREKGR